MEGRNRSSNPPRPMAGGERGRLPGSLFAPMYRTASGMGSADRQGGGAADEAVRHRISRPTRRAGDAAFEFDNDLNAGIGTRDPATAFPFIPG